MLSQRGKCALTSTSGRQLAVMSMQTARSSSLCLSAATCTLRRYIRNVQCCITIRGMLHLSAGL